MSKGKYFPCCFLFLLSSCPSRVPSKLMHVRNAGQRFTGLQNVGVLLRHRGCLGLHGCGSPGRRGNPPVLFKSCGATDLLPAFTGWRKIKIWDQFKHLFKSFEQKLNMFLNSYYNNSGCPYNKRQIIRFQRMSMCVKRPPSHIFLMHLICHFHHSFPHLPSDKVKLPENRWDQVCNLWI